MALLLIKQTYSHTRPSGRKEYHQWFFNTSTLAVQTSVSLAREMEEYEANTGQWIYWNGFTHYYYDGNGGIYSDETERLYSFTIVVVPPEGGTATDLTDDAPYPKGASLPLLAEPAPGFEFVSWTRKGAVVSTDPEFTYDFPGPRAVIVANFSAIVPPPPAPVPTRFYDLELRVKGAQIPIPGLLQRIITGLFSSEMEGDRSYPVNIPVTPPLMIALGNPQDPQSNADFSKPFPAELWSHGNRLYSGFLDILKSDDNKIRATYLLDSAFFISQNKPLLLTDCYAADEVISIADQPIIAIGGYEIRFSFQYWIRVKINEHVQGFFSSQFENHILMLEAVFDWLLSLGLGLDAHIEYSEDLTDSTSKIVYWDTTEVTECTLEVFLPGREEWVTQRYSNPKKLTSKRMEMEEWNQFSPENRIAFPSIYNRELYEGNNPMHDGIVNRYDEAGRLFFSNLKYLTFFESFRWAHCIVPFLYLSDVVKTVFRKLNIMVSGEAFFSDPRVKHMLLYNNRTLDYLSVKVNDVPVRKSVANIQEGQTRGAEEEYEDNYWYENVHDLDIKLKNHVPEVSVVEFLKALKSYFGLKYDFNILQNRVEIRFIRDIIRQREVIDFTKKASRVYVLTHSKETGMQFTYENPDPLMSDGTLSQSGIEGERDLYDPTTIADYVVQNYLAMDALDAVIEEIAYVHSLRAYFQLTTNQDEPPYWKLYAFVQQDDLVSGADLQEGQGNTRRNWSIGMVPLIDSFTYGRKMPAIECTANNPEVNLTNKECGLRIFGFYGQQLDGNNQPYSFASCTRYDAKELESESQYDLDIRSEDNAPYWKELESIIDRGKPYETSLLLESTDFIRLSRTPIIRIANIDYLIDEYEVAISTKEMSIAKVKLWKIK